MVKPITIETVSNGWVVSNQGGLGSVPEILAVFNDVYDLSTWVRGYLQPNKPEAAKPCNNPYCECDPGSCSLAGFYDARA